MSVTEHRPRFRLITPFNQEEVCMKFKEAFDQDRVPTKIYGTVLPKMIVVKLPLNEQTYWSPQMELHLEQMEFKQTLLRGMMGPRPAIWTKFMFIYAVFGLVAMISLMIGSSQLTLGQEANAFWFSGVALLGLGTTFAFVQYGKSMAKSQMAKLYSFMLNQLENKVEQAPDFT